MRISSKLLSLLILLSFCTLSVGAYQKTRLKRPTSNFGHHGGTARTVVSIPAKSSLASRPLNLSSFVRHNFAKVATPPIAKARLMRLNNKDVVVFIDKSSSMNKTDINDGISRWDWSRVQLTDLSSKLTRLPQSSLDVVFFNSGARKYRSVKMNSIPSIFAQNYPHGGTNITRALDDELDQFFARRAHRTVASRPLVIAVITDGAPSSSRALKELIKETTHKINSPRDLKITFLQVGFEDKGNRLMPELDHGLVQNGAKFDIVDTKTFKQVGRMGLVNALIQAVS